MMEQLLAHLVGDYLLQPHSMAVGKLKSWRVALLHGFAYMTPFILLTQSIPALLTIALTHAVIDRLRLAKYAGMIKNAHFKGDGYPDGTPDYLRVWLMIITDNILHLLINYAALRWMT